MPYVLLRSMSVSVVVSDDDAVPRIVHWGAPVDDVDGVDALLDVAVPQGSLDVAVPMGLLPEAARGWSAYGGISAHRDDGTAWAPLLQRSSSGLDGSSFTWRGSDSRAGVSATIALALDEHGVLRVAAELTNDGDDVLHVSGFAPVLPVPQRAVEVLSLTGRWAREMVETRTMLDAGALVLENRRGRTSHEVQPTLMAGTRGFAQETGEVWAAHLSWSGDHAMRAEVLPDGRRTLSLAELLLPGEIRLQPGATYAAPAVLAAWSAHGLNGISESFHQHVRARSTHPRTPRPVLLNTWEAVYFTHDLDELRRLADAAAEAGVERFVLDDGWFRGRNDDTTSLGDWYVDATKYPDGLEPLIRHVTGLGMQFGLWVEPEMVNRDSDLFRAHPDWVLGVDGVDQVMARHQLVLDLARPEVSAYLFDRIDDLLTAYDIAYLKWDMNRDLVAAGGRDGAAGVHAQTLALYALMDRIRATHPGVEIESCASGGGRVDLGIAARTDRFWTSDCNDALERQRIQRGFSYVVPPELMGAHIGGEWAHTTARRQWFPFRGATAFFGHLGLEWNLLRASAEDRAAVRDTIALHKRMRPLLHHGRTVRVDHPDSSALVHGVVARDGSEALFSYAQLTAPDRSAPAPLRLVGLDPRRRYRVERLLLPGANWAPGKHEPSWYADGLEADGTLLGAVGVPLGIHVPEQATLVHAVAL
ncbi:MAG TPA: alpha-galactosidase [Candidatus Nanopelagicales bacterium]|nr:alpha-galactosidase [Candidatus Nanopelagicales bacterium]